MTRDDAGSHQLTLTIGREELRIRGVYETLSIVNDFLAGVLFLVGSILFFWESTMVTATWLFVLGSVLFVGRPTIRLTRRVHLARVAATPSTETARDF
ncbi:YrhK family protein [Janibacter sp. GS2]|uniref:YrhK family protein n=1 Tax=Janibacter sp. GS2 TaxID=3442646 RepID=UPI003EBEC319